jgi:hypothetical protein
VKEEIDNLRREDQDLEEKLDLSDFYYTSLSTILKDLNKNTQEPTDLQIRSQ